MHLKLETGDICFQKAEQTSMELIFRHEVGRNPLSKRKFSFALNRTYLKRVHKDEIYCEYMILRCAGLSEEAN